MPHHTFDSAQLRPSIGQSVLHNNIKGLVIELLEHPPALVIELCHDYDEIQPDQNGEAHRRTPKTITIPVFDPDEEGEINPAFIALGLSYPF